MQLIIFLILMSFGNVIYGSGIVIKTDKCNHSLCVYETSRGQQVTCSSLLDGSCPTQVECEQNNNKGIKSNDDFSPYASEINAITDRYNDYVDVANERNTDLIIYTNTVKDLEDTVNYYTQYNPVIDLSNLKRDALIDAIYKLNSDTEYGLTSLEISIKRLKLLNQEMADKIKDKELLSDFSEKYKKTLDYLKKLEETLVKRKSETDIAISKIVEKQIASISSIEERRKYQDRLNVSFFERKNSLDEVLSTNQQNLLILERKRRLNQISNEDYLEQKARIYQKTASIYSYLDNVFKGTKTDATKTEFEKFKRKIKNMMSSIASRSEKRQLGEQDGRTEMDRLQEEMEKIERRLLMDEARRRGVTNIENWLWEKGYVKPDRTQAPRVISDPDNRLTLHINNEGKVEHNAYQANFPRGELHRNQIREDYNEFRRERAENSRFQENLLGYSRRIGKYATNNNDPYVGKVQSHINDISGRILKIEDLIKKRSKESTDASNSANNTIATATNTLEDKPIGFLESNLGIAIQTGVSFIPVVGDVSDLGVALYQWANNDITLTEAGLIAALSFGPISATLAKKLLPKIKKGAKVLREMIKSGALSGKKLALLKVMGEIDFSVLVSIVSDGAATVGDMVSYADKLGYKESKNYKKFADRVKEFVKDEAGEIRLDRLKKVTSGLKSAKFPGSKEMARRFGTTEKKFHRVIKKKIKKDFPDELKLISAKNPDIGINKSGEIILKNPQTGSIINTGIKLTYYREF